MKPKNSSNPFDYNFLLFGVFLAFIILFVLRSSFTSSHHVTPPPVPRQDHAIDSRKATNCSSMCDKIPAPLAQALIHYTTSTIVPRQTRKEISVTARVLKKKSPCNFLVFGLGHESLMWSSLNYRGRTVFLEEDELWIQKVKRRFPMLESYHVMYHSKEDQVDKPMEVGRSPECTAVIDPRYSTCPFALKGLPVDVYETKWDLIMVNGKALGRMKAIYMVGMMARNRKEGETDVFVHDINWPVDGNFSKAFLCQRYMKKEEGRLRHFNIPNHRDNIYKPFCPN